MIKASKNGYVKTKVPHRLLGTIEVLVVPTGKTRTETDGKVAAEFILISGKSLERKIWLKRNEIY